MTNERAPRWRSVAEHALVALPFLVVFLAKKFGVLAPVAVLWMLVGCWWLHRSGAVERGLPRHPLALVGLLALAALWPCGVYVELFDAAEAKEGSS